uniref:Putative secreted protein n=1 Tax=Ixodes ricinus TaxID=34613 RepID=A0A6B0U7M9_IXORI
MSICCRELACLALVGAFIYLCEHPSSRSWSLLSSTPKCDASNIQSSREFVFDGTRREKLRFEKRRTSVAIFSFSDEPGSTLVAISRKVQHW